MELKPTTNYKLKALFTIVDYSLDHKITELYKKYELPISLITHGHGAANSDIYDILGFGESKKIIVFNILTEAMEKRLYQILHTEMKFNKPGTGIAFSIPINGVNNVLLQLCTQSELKMLCNNMSNEREEYPMQHSEPFDLIITIVNNGYFNDVMDIAKANGATGGTLVHARGLETKEASKFFGITIQPEKDIVLILTPHEKKLKIMESIAAGIGLSTPGQGICFSLPVSDALGLGLGTQAI